MVLFHPLRLDALHNVIINIRPEWTRSSLERAARKLPDNIAFDEFVTRAVRAGLDPHTATPHRLVTAWDEYGSGVPAPPPEPADDKRFLPGTRIRRDDPFPGDRDPLTGRTDPARQRARVALLTARIEPAEDDVLYPPPPGFESWEAAGRALLSGRLPRGGRDALARYSRSLPRDGR